MMFETSESSKGIPDLVSFAFLGLGSGKGSVYKEQWATLYSVINTSNIPHISHQVHCRLSAHARLPQFLMAIQALL